MSMIKDALDLLFSKASEQANTRAPKLFEVPGDGRTVVVESNGTLTDRKVPPPLRNHTVRSVDDMILAAMRWKSNPVLWIDRDRIVLVPDDEDRREFVTLPLKQTNLFETIAELGDRELDQPALIHLLRFELREATGVETMLAAVRNLKFRTSDAGQSNLQHGNESLGASVEAEVTGAGDLPETLLVGTSVFTNPGEDVFTAEIELGLEINTRRRLFYLSPMPDTLEDAMHGAMESIRSRLAASLAEVAVFYGSPFQTN